MTTFKLAALAATSMIAAAQAQAATYIFSSGTYSSGVTSPNPLGSDILVLDTGATKFFGASFTNASGRIDWTGGAIGLFNGASVTNAGLWRALGDDGVSLASGGGTFVNTGIFRKEGSTGITAIGAPFVNSGTIDATTGTIQFSATGIVFNSGTSFTGAGTNLVSGGATFNGAFRSTNLDLSNGTYNGNAAALNGSADFLNGNMAGSWAVNAGATLNLTTDATKYFAGNFTNGGTVAWSAGDVSFFGGGNVVNAGTWLASSDNQFTQSSGGGTFTNDGLFRKTAGTTTTIGAPFVNNGQVDAAVGTIQFSGPGIAFNSGTSFTGSGTNLVSGGATFTGGFTSSNLDLSNGTYVGNAAAVNGSVDFLSGNMAGTWAVNSGATLNLTGASTKYITDSLTNNGTVAWSSGDVGLFGGGNLVNTGTWLATGDNQLIQASGGGTFTNSGLFRKAAGITTLVGAPFINNGQVDAAVGTIQFSGPGIVFNAGTTFTGAGVNLIQGSATFAGAFTSSNLDFGGGTYFGNGAGLNGSADFLAGNMAGSWAVNAGATMNLTGSSTKFFTDSFANNGTVAWSSGDVGVFGGGTVTNNGAWVATGDNALSQASGGGTFTNNGLFQKTGGTTTSVNMFVNNGQIDAAVGTIQFASGPLTFNAGTSFTGAGINRMANSATFNGAFSSTNLDFTSGSFTGNAATMNGSVDLIGGNFVGNWTVAAGATANAIGTTSFTDSFTNNGQINWSGGDLGVYGGGNFANAGTVTASSDNQLFQASGGGTATNSGLIVKTGGTGTTTIGTPFVNTGTLDVESGTIQLPGNFVNAGTMAGTATFGVSGTLTNNGIVSPGSSAGAGVGTLALAGNYFQGAGGFFDVSFGSNVADLFNISGTAALNGGLRLYCASCSVSAGQIYTILDSVGDLSGLFSSTGAFGFNNGFAYTVLYDTTLDRVQLRIDNGGTVTPPTNPGAVPEPSSWAMLIAGFGAIGATMRRSRRRGAALA